jgi:hypothetical protein
MSQVKDKDELLTRINELQEEIKKLVDDFFSFVANTNTNKKKKKPKKSIAQIERENDTQCLALLKSGKRCSKKRSVNEEHDPELCKLHNNQKYKNNVKKVELPPLLDTKNQEDSDDNAEESEDSEFDGLKQVKLTIDTDGHAIDQEGNIWDMGKQEIIGKKDIRTKRKVFFKNV